MTPLRPLRHALRAPLRRKPAPALKNYGTTAVFSHVCVRVCAHARAHAPTRISPRSTRSVSSDAGLRRSLLQICRSGRRSDVFFVEKERN
jgi:hypothetical protein